MVRVEPEEDPMDIFGSYTSTIIAVLSTIVLVVVIHFLFRKTVESSKRWPYQRQFLVFLIVLVGLFMSIAFLPIHN
jgi:MFS superfamily sulfate permease-like transporter